MLAGHAATALFSSQLYSHSEENSQRSELSRSVKEKCPGPAQPEEQFGKGGRASASPVIIISNYLFEVNAWVLKKVLIVDDSA
jgi:hypothetical protein